MSEILGTLFKYLMALLGIAVVVGVLYAVLHKNKAGTEASNLTSLSTNISTTYVGQSTFTGLTTAICAKLAPQSMAPAGAGTMVNQWGGSVTCAVDANPSQYDVVENGVDSSGCTDLVNQAKNYVSVILGGTTYNTANPLDAGTAVTVCNAANPQTITFVYGK